MITVAKKSLGLLLAALMVVTALVAMPTTAAQAASTSFTIASDGKTVTIGNLDYYQSRVRNLNLASLDTSSMVDRLNNESTELLVLQAGLVQKVGYDTIKSVVDEHNGAEETLVWLMTDVDALRDYVTGGTPNHSDYKKSLQVLSDLYTGSKTIECTATTGYGACGDKSSKTYYFKDDLNNTGSTQIVSGTNNNMTLGDVYRTLMIATSLTHDGKIGFWTGWSNNKSAEYSNAVDRYWVLRTLRSDYEKYKFDAATFDSLTVPEMRLITGAWITDRQLAWLNWYYRTNRYTSTNWTNQYFTYRFGWNYGKGEYYSSDNQQKWENKYHMAGWNDDDAMLADYDLNYGTVNGMKEHQPWIVFEEGGVCGSQAKTSQNLAAASGRPGIVVSQPSHAAFLRLSINSNGQGIWNTWNFISNWGQTGINDTNDGLTIMLLGWGVEQSSWKASYTLLAQAALNQTTSDYVSGTLKHGDIYYLATELQIVAGYYDDGSNEQIAVLKAAFDVQPLNWDTLKDLSDAYKAAVNSDNAALDDYAAAMVNGVRALDYYPLPAWQLMVIGLNYVTTSNSKQWTRIYDAGVNSMEASKKATSSNVLQTDPSIQVSTRILNANTVSGYTYQFPFTFAFDLNGDTSTITPKGNWSSASGEYSIDGGNTWHSFTGTTELSAEMTSQITATNDVKVKYSNDRTWTFDITGAKAAPTTTAIYANDRENKIFGDTSGMEYSTDDGETWTSFESGVDAVFPGNQTVLIRYKRTTSTTDPGMPSTVTFTDEYETEDSEHKYVTIDHLSVSQVSTSRDDYPAANFIDGNINTMWSTLFRNNDKNGRYFTVQLDQPRTISMVEYYRGARISACGGDCYSWPGDLTVAVSMDGKNWTEIGSVTGLPTGNNSANATAPVIINIEEPTLARYVRLQNKNTGSTSRAFSGALFNIFEQASDPVSYESVSVEVQTDSEKWAWAYSPTRYTKYDLVSYNFGYYNELSDVSTDSGDIKNGLVYGSFTGASIEETTNSTVKEALLDVANQTSGQKFTDLNDVVSWLMGDSEAVEAFTTAAGSHNWSDVSGYTQWNYTNSGDWSDARAYRPSSELGAGVYLLVDKSGKLEPTILFSPYTDLEPKMGVLERIYYPTDSDGNLLTEIGPTASSSQSIWGRTQWGYSIPEQTSYDLYVGVAGYTEGRETTNDTAWMSDMRAGVSMTIEDSNGKTYQVVTNESGWATLENVTTKIYDEDRKLTTLTVTDSSDEFLIEAQFIFVFQGCSNTDVGRCEGSEVFLNRWISYSDGKHHAYLGSSSPLNAQSFVFLTETPAGGSGETPDTPTELKLTESTTSGSTWLTASWSAVDNAMAYSVQFYQNGDKYSDAMMVVGTNCSIEVTEFGTYTFTVTAINNGLPGTPSEHSPSYTYADKVPGNDVITISYEQETVSYDTALYELSSSPEFEAGTLIANGASISNYAGQSLYLRYLGSTSSTEIILQARAGHPTGLTAVNASADDQADGKITGVNATMEYRLTSSDSWTQITGDTTEITGLSAGVYEVRTAATTSSFASNAASLTIGVGADTTPGGNGDDNGDGSTGGDNGGSSTSGDNSGGSTGGNDGSTADSLAATGISIGLSAVAVLVLAVGLLMSILRNRAEKSRSRQ